jgi:hypothetical protein
MKIVETLAVGVAATMTVDDALAMMDEVGVAATMTVDDTLAMMDEVGAVHGGTSHIPRNDLFLAQERVSATPFTPTCLHPPHHLVPSLSQPPRTQRTFWVHAASIRLPAPPFSPCFVDRGIVT